MKDKTFLMIPGPTPVPESVMTEIAKHPIGHRSSEFSAVLERVYSNLKYVFQIHEQISSLFYIIVSGPEIVSPVFIRYTMCIKGAFPYPKL